MADQFDKNFYFINHTVVLWCSIGDTAEHSDPFLFSGIGKKPIMSYFCKVLRKHVKKEPSDKLRSCNGHFFDFTVIAVILVSKGNHAIIKSLNTGIGNCNPVRIPAQIMDDGIGIVKWLFCIDKPVLSVTGIDHFIERADIFKTVIIKPLSEFIQKLSSEQGRKDMNRKNKLVPGNPFLIFSISASGKNHMKMRMERERG